MPTARMVSTSVPVNLSVAEGCRSCVAGHASGINCLDVSPDGRFLVAVGLNSHSKQLVILWNIAGLVDGHKVTFAQPSIHSGRNCLLRQNVLRQSSCIQAAKAVLVPGQTRPYAQSWSWLESLLVVVNNNHCTQTHALPAWMNFHLDSRIWTASACMVPCL